MREEITITFNDDGSTKVEGSGFRGAACEKATRPFEEALGVPEGQRQIKPEHRLPATNAVKAGR